ncbi:hypothetical protein IT411_03350 [Candidatus Peregrinibacteria bacterium]|nr:hypothetical protein [Candidatus Peregrinibacteria bacterium]
MKQFLLSATILVFVLIIIVFFQNLANTVDGLWILLYQFDQQTSASLGVIVLCGLGFLAGALSTCLAISIVNEGKDEEAPGGSSW